MKITATAVLNLKQPHVSSHLYVKAADRSGLSIEGTSSLRVINEYSCRTSICATFLENEK
jgi:hypothetical protein